MPLTYYTKENLVKNIGEERGVFFFLHKLGLGKIQLAMNPRFLLALGLVQQNGENCPNLYKMGVVVTSWLIGRTCSLSLGPLAAVRRDCRIYDECGFF